MIQDIKRKNSSSEHHAKLRKHSLPHLFVDWLEDNIFGVILVTLVLVVIIVFSILFWPKNSNTSFYFNSCLGEWSNNNHAEGPPTVLGHSDPNDFNLNNSAVLVRNTGAIFCGDLYGDIPVGTKPNKAELHLRMALIDELFVVVELDKDAINEDGQLSQDAISQGEGFFDIRDTVDRTLSESGSSNDTQTEDIFSGYLIDEDEPFLEIYFSYDKGKNWILADRVGRTNWKDLSYTIPFFNWAVVDNFEVSIHGVKRIPDQPDVYLDSAWLTVEYEDQLESINDTTSLGYEGEDASFSADGFNKDEEPSFKVFEEFTNISCQIKPFSVDVERGSEANFEVELAKVTDEMPYRLSVVETPDSMQSRITVSDLGEDGESIMLHLETSPGTTIGSYGMSLLYEGLVEKGIFRSGDRYESTFCRFNLNVL